MRICVLLSLLIVTGCRSTPPPPTVSDNVQTTAATIEPDASFVSAATELGVAVVDAGGVHALAAPPVSGQSAAIAAGSFASGSMPGDEGRQASIEPALVDVKLGAYAIDLLPYPNDPSQPPALVTSVAEAAKACSDAGARLCTELEWERACKGPSGEAFATGAAWDAACDKAPSRCASGFGPRAMGFLSEWTDSTFDDDKVPVVRGGPKGRRCAARIRLESPAEGSRRAAKEVKPIAFRCCHGDRNDAVVPAIEAKPAFRRTSLDAADLTKIFSGIPELARLRDGIRIFVDADVKSSILGRSSAAADGISFAPSPLLWSPEPGIELLVATGRAKKSGFVVALWVLRQPGTSADDLGAQKYRFASSFVLLNDAAPVALAYEPARRKELRWTSCWSCAGEQGSVSLRDDGRVVIVQH